MAWLQAAQSDLWASDGIWLTVFVFIQGEFLQPSSYYIEVNIYILQTHSADKGFPVAIIAVPLEHGC